MALTLPEPNQHFEGEDDLAPKARTQNEGMAQLKKSEELLKGIIYPSREIRGIIDKTAVHIAKSPSPQLLEDRIREHQKADPKFSFLRDSDPFNRYYRYMIEKVGEDGEETALAQSTGAVAGDPSNASDESVPGKETESERREREENLRRTKAQEVLTEPRAYEFTTDLPSVTSIDLDVLRLTAMFTARQGRRFLEGLSVREGRNFQFDFLRPSHSLYGYFNRMVEQYTKVMHPSSQQIARLENGQTNKWAIMEESQARGEWEKVRRDKEQKKKEDAEKEAHAFAEIDWQDFAVVQNIEFTSADQSIELPAPTNIDALRTMGLNERRMAAMIVEESGDHNMPLGAGSASTKDAGPVLTEGGPDEVEMDEDSDDEETQAQKKRETEELARAREIQAKAMGQAGMKIRKDYQPKGLTGKQVTKAKVPMAICPNCQQSIPESEISEHIRIELLDPRWREQKQLLEQRKTQQALLTQNADVTGSLKQLANARTDLFGTAEEEEKRKQQEEEERAARRAKEAIIWDGHTASKASTLETFSSRFNLDEQIAAIHRKNQLLPASSGPSIGPQFAAGPIGTASHPTGGAESTPAGVFTGASLSAGPSAPSAHVPVNPYGQFVPFPNQPAFDPSMFQSNPMPSYPSAVQPGLASDSENPGLPLRPGNSNAMHPARLAALGGTSPSAGSPHNPPGSFAPHVAGQIRPYDPQMSTEEHVAKRPRIEKLPGGQFYPESEWIAMHPNPISLSVRLPDMPDKPEWKLNGAIITIDDLPLNFLVSTLRDRIVSLIGAQLPISRMRLDYGSKVLSNASTLASVNLDEGDMVALSIRKK